MAIVLKVVSGLYLAFIWMVFAIAASTPMPPSLGGAGHLLTFLIAIGLSVPAVALFAFGQVVGDIRIMRDLARQQSNDLHAVRRYYEPEQPRGPFG